MSETLFVRAARIVDCNIAESGVAVDVVTRNKRVLAVIEHLKSGRPESEINHTAALSTVRFRVDRSSAGEGSEG